LKTAADARNNRKCEIGAEDDRITLTRRHAGARGKRKARRRNDRYRRRAEQIQEKREQKLPRICKRELAKGEMPMKRGKKKRNPDIKGTQNKENKKGRGQGPAMGEEGGKHKGRRS